MTPRWTIDEDGLLRCDGKFFGNYDVCGHQPGSYDALVAAVRDADTLRHAQQIASEVRALRRSGQTASFVALSNDLLDLLSSPAPQGEGTE